MDGLSEMTAASVAIEIRGETYLLSPLRAQDYGEMERHILANRPRPLDVVKPQLAGLSKEQQRCLLELAYREQRAGDRVSLDELHAWMDSLEGQVYLFWLMLRRQQPRVTLAQAEILLEAAVEEEQNSGAISRSLGLPAMVEAADDLVAETSLGKPQGQARASLAERSPGRASSSA